MVSVCICVYNVCVVVRGQLCEVSSLILLLCGSPGPKSACWALGRVPLLTEPSCQSFVDFLQWKNCRYHSAHLTELNSMAS